MNKRSQKAWLEFHERIVLLGGRVTEPNWLGSNAPHECFCIAKHRCFPSPANVQQGHSICTLCRNREIAARERKRKEERFVKYLGWYGSKLISEYITSRSCVIVECADGHLCRIIPTMNRAHPCPSCIGRNPEHAYQKFLEKLQIWDAELLEEKWLGKDTPHKVRCKSGHITSPTPGHLRDRSHVCRTCNGMVWDIFYIVSNQYKRIIKFGITSYNPNRRLNDHARNGFTQIVMLKTQIPYALEIESTIKIALIELGHYPVTGTEYFSIDLQPIIQQIAECAITERERKTE